MERTATRRLQIAAVLIGAVWLPIILLWGPAPFSLTFDDAWYYFEIARHLADGAGSTFDGINHTNGYHPLWMGIATVPYLVGMTQLAAVRLLLVLQLVGWVTTLSLVGRSVAATLGRPSDHPHPDDVARWRDGIVLAAFVALGANPFVLKLFVNGLESGVAALLQCVVLLRVLAVDGHVVTATGRRWRLVTGFVLGLTFLARTDAVLLFAVLGFWAVLEAWPLGRDRILALVELFVIPAVVAGLYLASNVVIFGHATQVSGDIKRLPLTAGRALIMAVVIAVAVLITVKAQATPSKPPRLGRTRAFLHANGWYGSFVLVLIAYYTVLQSVPYLWYFAPAALLGIWLALLVLADLSEGAALESPEKAPRAAVLPIALILGLPILLGALYQSRTFVDPHLRSIQTTDREAAEWANDHLPPDAVIGSFDAGVIGYFSERPVINLDGVVNSFEYRDAARSGHAGEFLRAEHITHLMNHGTPVDGEDPDMRALANTFIGRGVGPRLRLVRRWEFLYSGNLDGSRTDQSTKHLAVFLYEVPP